MRYPIYRANGVSVDGVVTPGRSYYGLDFKVGTERLAIATSASIIGVLTELHENINNLATSLALMVRGGDEVSDDHRRLLAVMMGLPIIRRGELLQQVGGYTRELNQIFGDPFISNVEQIKYMLLITAAPAGAIFPLTRAFDEELLFRAILYARNGVRSRSMYNRDYRISLKQIYHHMKHDFPHDREIAAIVNYPEWGEVLGLQSAEIYL